MASAPSSFQNVQSLLDLFKPKGGGTVTNTVEEKASPEAMDAVVKSILGGTQGLAAVSSGQHAAGLYDSSTNQMLTNDLIARTAAEAAKMNKTTKTTQTTVPTAQLNFGKTAATLLGGKLLTHLLKGNSLDNLFSSSNKKLGGDNTDDNSNIDVGGITADSEDYSSSVPDSVINAAADANASQLGQEASDSLTDSLLNSSSTDDTTEAVSNALDESSTSDAINSAVDTVDDSNSSDSLENLFFADGGRVPRQRPGDKGNPYLILPNSGGNTSSSSNSSNSNAAAQVNREGGNEMGASDGGLSTLSSISLGGSSEGSYSGDSGSAPAASSGPSNISSINGQDLAKLGISIALGNPISTVINGANVVSKIITGKSIGQEIKSIFNPTQKAGGKSNDEDSSTTSTESSPGNSNADNSVTTGAKSSDGTGNAGSIQAAEKAKVGTDTVPSDSDSTDVYSTDSTPDPATTSATDSNATTAADEGTTDASTTPDSPGSNYGNLGTSETGALVYDSSYTDSYGGDPNSGESYEQAVIDTGVFANGGNVPGHDTEGKDDVPIRVSGGEYVIPTDVVDKVGEPFFDHLLQLFHAPIKKGAK